MRQVRDRFLPSQHPIRGREQHTEADIDEIHVGEAEHELAVEDDAFVEQAVDEIEQAWSGDSSRRASDRRSGGGRTSSVSIERREAVGGHGPGEAHRAALVQQRLRRACQRPPERRALAPLDEKRGVEQQVRVPAGRLA